MNLNWFELRFPSGLEADAVVHFARTLSMRPRRGLFMTAEPVVGEVTGNRGRLTWRLAVSPRDQQTVITNLRQAIPDLLIEMSDRPVSQPSRVWELRIDNPRRPLRTDNPEQLTAALLPVMLTTGEHEHVALQLVIGPWLPRHAVPPATTRRKDNELPFVDIAEAVRNSEEVKALRDKQAEPLFGVVGRIAVTASSSARQRQLRQRVLGALQLVRAPGVGIDRRLLPQFVTKSHYRSFHLPTFAYPLVLNARELATLLAWPVGNPLLQNVAYTGHRRLPALSPQLVQSAAPSRGHRITGRSAFPGRPGYVRLKTDDWVRGLHVVGPTGTGKSNLLAELALQDIAAGRGVVVIDPKSDLVEAIADRIPRERLDDVVLIDPRDSAPVGINVLRTPGEPDWAADVVLHVMRDLFSANWGQRTADVIHNGVLTLIRHGDLTLCELAPLLTNKAFRQQVTARVRGDVLGVAGFWHWFEALSEAERSAVIAPVLNKLRSFTNRTSIRAVLGQTEGFDLGSVFRQRKVVLINLATGDAGSESGQLLGSLILGVLWAHVNSRTAVAPERRHACAIYIDEFADVMRLPLDLGEALVKARGLGVGLTLAHQHLGQLSSQMRAAVEANARSRIVFQCGHGDASALAKLLGSGLTANDLQHLSPFETYQALCHQGATAPPASVSTIEMRRSAGTLEAVRATSRSRFGVPRRETDAALVARRTTKAPVAAIGSKKRGAS